MSLHHPAHYTSALILIYRSIQDGMTPNCTLTADVATKNGLTCEDILDIYELTITQFYKMNPSVGADCSGMWVGRHLKS